MTTTTLLLARHGETLDNARRVFQGQGGSALNRLGRAQADRLAQRMQRDPPSVVITSDLERAVETARASATLCKAPLELEPGLREIDVGAWTGKSYDTIRELYPDEWAAWEAGLDIRRGGGETYAELAERMDHAIAKIADAHAGERVLIVSHGGAIKSWIAKLLRVEGEGMRVLGGVANTGLSMLDCDTSHHGRRFRLHLWNDVSHLQGLAVDELVE